MDELILEASPEARELFNAFVGAERSWMLMIVLDRATVARVRAGFGWRTRSVLT